jgi:hypothetical protein
VCNDCGVVQRSSLAFTGPSWSNGSTAHIGAEISNNKIHAATCVDIDSICERLELDTSVCLQAKEELQLFCKVCLAL